MTKRQGYEAMTRWLEEVSGPTVLGFDGNTWNLSLDLEPGPAPEGDNPWSLEHRLLREQQDPPPPRRPA